MKKLNDVFYKHFKNLREYKDFKKSIKKNEY